jgi:Ca2+-binding EF-hand superfamily protein
MIPEEDQKDLPEDENTPDKRADKVWEFFGKKEDGNFDCEEFSKCDRMRTSGMRDFLWVLHN